VKADPQVLTIPHVGAVVACAVAVGSSAEVDEAADDGQLDLPSGGHGELPSGGQRDYFV
jgi:hypothetical protein